MKTFDARGVSCPEPLLMMKRALETEKEIILLVDSKNALENCQGYAREKGFSVSTTAGPDKYEIHVSATK